MAKDKLVDYDSTASNNLDVGGISVAEGMLPSNVNNAIREQMSHLKDFAEGTQPINALAVDNLKMDGNTISSTNTNGDITIDPDGTGNTIVASGNVGIGAASPSQKLDVAAGGKLYLRRADNATGTEIYNGGSAVGTVIDDLNNEPISFKQSGSEKMRISSGNLLVGKTTLNYTTITGGIIRNDGLVSAVRDGGNVVNFQRLSDDGEIIQVGKDGTRVGSIGTISGGTYIGSGDTGLFFEPVTNQIRPFNTSTVSSIDATIDLGRSTNRFKDLYLSGGVVFGTGGPSPITSNTLDDYEEGSWTATFAASTTTATGYYVKVGATVFFTVYGNSLNVTSTGTSAAISGLPFANSGGYTVASITHDTYSNNSYNGYVLSGGTSVYPIQDGTVSSSGTVAGNPRYIMVSGTYITDS